MRGAIEKTLMPFSVIRRYLPMALLLCCAGIPVPSWAHSASQSAILLDFHGSAVDLELQLPVERMEAVLAMPVTQQSLDRERTRITTYILSHLSAKLPDGRHLSIAEIAPPGLMSIDGASYVVAHFRATPPADAALELFDLHSYVLLDRIPAQVALVSIRSDWRTSTFANDPKLLGVIRAGEESVVVDRRDGSWWQGFENVFRLGMRHIAEGTDHLLFLLVLLLPAPLLVLQGRWAGYSGIRQCIWQIATVVTAFTAGHSVTLALGALDLVHVPSRPIEVLIAASILVSAFHALRPVFPGREAVIAGCFGLVHGLAFATTLAELGLGRWERVASILGFNLGIEVMQLIVVAAVMPSLILLSRTRLYGTVRVTGALFAATAAAGWIGERLANLPNPFDAFVMALAQRAPWVAVGLFLLGVTASSWARFHGRFQHASSRALPGDPDENPTDARVRVTHVSPDNNP